MEQNETRTLWISIGSAIFAVILLYGWAQDKRAGYARKFGQTKTVVIASDDIKEFEIVDESKLEVVEKPSDFIQPAALDNPTEIVGQIALAPIKKGEQILNTKLVFPSKSTGLSMQVAPGKRAVTIPVDEIRGVAKLINPGDHVDIIAALDVGEGTNKKRVIRTILYDVPVLAAGKAIVDNLPINLVANSDGDTDIRNLRVENNYKHLTIEVKPSDAQVLMLLQSQGLPIYTSLRNPNDRYVNKLKTSDINDALSRVRVRKPAKVVKPKPKPKPKARPKRRGRFEKI